MFIWFIAIQMNIKAASEGCLRYVSHLLVCLHGSDILCLLSFCMIFPYPVLVVFFNLSSVMCHLFVLIPFSLVCSYLCVNIAIVINSSVPKNSSSTIWLGISLCKHSFFSGIHNILQFSFKSSFLSVFLFFLVDALEQLNWDYYTLCDHSSEFFPNHSSYFW